MKHDHRNFLVALTGQPNVGKSTVFNMLTGAHQHVANFPGVTVDKKQGSYTHDDHRIEVVDLPGTYSLTSYTQEERIARDFILLQRPEVVVVVIDASNLERNLYFALQVREMEVPIVLCLNMMDVADRRGVKIDTEKLSDALNIPVVPVIGKKNVGRDELRKAIVKTCQGANHRAPQWALNYGEGLEPIVQSLTERLRTREHLMEDFSARWLAVKLLEDDGEARRIALHHTHDEKGGELVKLADELREGYKKEYGKRAQKVIASLRYRTAGEIVSKCTELCQTRGQTWSDRIDSLLLHRVLGPVCLIIILFVFYQITMTLGTKLSDLVAPLGDSLRIPVEAMFQSNDAIRESLLQSMLVDGVLAGVTTLLYYVPLFFVLFTMLAMLEDTGYMARIAFLLDRVLRVFGLHGQSTLPLILGGVVAGGCAVPGIVATRAMRDEKARIVTILIMPLMNCAAKIPIFAMIIATWVSDESLMPGVGKRGAAMFGLTLFTFSSSLVLGKIFSSYIVKGQHAPFVLELPVYHLPTVSTVLRRAWQRIWSFIKKLFTIIIVIQVIVWYAMTFPSLTKEREAAYDQELADAVETLATTVPADSRFAKILQSAEQRLALAQDFMTAREGMERQGMQPGTAPTVLPRVSPDAFLLANLGVDASGKTSERARLAGAAFERFVESLVTIRLDRKREILTRSFAGRVGRGLEPLSKQVGFDWRLNISLISSFAARENLVGTLGTIHNMEFDKDESLSAFISDFAPGWSGWHTAALLVFVAMLPPCIPTILTIRSETGSNRWALFATIYPICIGFIIALIVFRIGPLLF